MSDSEIIWKYLTRSFPDQHHIIYIYCCGQQMSRENAVKRIFDDVYPIFGNVLSDSLIKTTVKGFLEYKKKQYLNAEIKVQSIY